MSTTGWLVKDPSEAVKESEALQSFIVGSSLVVAVLVLLDRLVAAVGSNAHAAAPWWVTAPAVASVIALAAPTPRILLDGRTASAGTVAWGGAVILVGAAAAALYQRRHPAGSPPV